MEPSVFTFSITIWSFPHTNTKVKKVQNETEHVDVVGNTFLSLTYGPFLFYSFLLFGTHAIHIPCLYLLDGSLHLSHSHTRSHIHTNTCSCQLLWQRLVCVRWAKVNIRDRQTLSLLGWKPVYGGDQLCMEQAVARIFYVLRSWVPQSCPNPYKKYNRTPEIKPVV